MPRFRIIAHRIRRTVITYEEQLSKIPTEAEAAAMIGVHALYPPEALHGSLKLVNEDLLPYGEQVYFEFVEPVEEDSDEPAIQLPQVD